MGSDRRENGRSPLGCLGCLVLGPIFLLVVFFALVTIIDEPLYLAIAAGVLVASGLGAGAAAKRRR